MTQITCEKDDVYTDITVMGHCNAGRVNGYDLCCCAVSMLTFTLMDSLKKLSLKKFKANYKGGWCHIRFENSGGHDSEAEIIINTVMNGFYLLKGRFPSNIHILNRLNKSEK